MGRSIAYFRRAIDVEPTYAAAYASLAEAYERLPMWLDEPPSKTLPLALTAVNQALRLDPNLPEAYASLGLINANYLWDWGSAERHFQRALELNPSSSPARHWYAEFLAEMGRTSEALDVMERAQLYDPMSIAVPVTRAFSLILARRFDEAIAEAERALMIDPDYPMALIRLCMAYDGKGMYGEAVRALRRAVRAAPGLLDCTALLSYAQARAGNREQAMKQMTELRRLARRRYVPAFLFANIYVALDKPDEAVRYIEKEYEARGWYLLLIKQAHQFDPLRAHPRFAALMHRMNFPSSTSSAVVG